MTTAENADLSEREMRKIILASYMVKCIGFIPATFKEEYGGTLNSFVDKFMDLPQELQRHIMAMYEDHTIWVEEFDRMLFKMVVNNVKPQMIDDVVTYFHASDEDHQEFAVRMFTNATEPVQYQPFLIDITGLGYYRLQDFHYDWTLPIRKQSERVRAQIHALHKFHAYAYSLPSKWQSGVEPVITVTANNMLGQPKIAQYVVAYPERADAVLAIVKERQTSDLKVIEEIVESETPALSGGML